MLPGAKRTGGSLTTSALAKGLKVALFLPKDSEGITVADYLRRIGCTVDAFWPPLFELPDNTDLIFFAAGPESHRTDYPWLYKKWPPVISVITFENPTIIDEVIRIGAMGIITTPIRASGLLSTIVLTLSHARRFEEKASKILRLEKKIAHLRQLSEAKSILMKLHNVPETEAYEILRTQAMTQRLAIEVIAGDIIRANAVLIRAAPSKINPTGGA